VGRRNADYPEHHECLKIAGRFNSHKEEIDAEEKAIADAQPYAKSYHRHICFRRGPIGTVFRGAAAGELLSRLGGSHAHCSKRSGDCIRNEPCARGVHVPVTVVALLMGIETLWDNQMKMVLRAGHRDVEQTTLFFDLGSASRRHIRWYAAINTV